MMPQLTIGRSDPHEPQATALLRASHALMQSLYPPESNFYLSIDDLCAPGITFLTARLGDGLLGTGALANKSTYGEIKSMFVTPEARGTGTGAALIAALEVEAIRQNLTLMRLETGPENTAAIRLYHRLGYATRGPFGDYCEDPHSLFMEKPLKAPAP